MCDVLLLIIKNILPSDDEDAMLDEFCKLWTLLFSYSIPPMQLYQIIHKFSNHEVMIRISNILDSLYTAICKPREPSAYINFVPGYKISFPLTNVNNDGITISMVYRIDKIRNLDNYILFSVFNKAGNGFYLSVDAKMKIFYTSIVDRKVVTVPTDHTLKCQRWQHLLIIHTNKLLSNTITVYI